MDFCLSSFTVSSHFKNYTRTCRPTKAYEGNILPSSYRTTTKTFISPVFVLAKRQINYAGKISNNVKRNSNTCAVSESDGGYYSTDIEKGQIMLQREGYSFIDLRSADEYELAHITKPPRRSFSFPDSSSASLASCVAASFPSTASPLLLACEDGGELSQNAALSLSQAGYTNIVVVEGGWKSWSNVWSTSGRRKPPSGRWVSTGTEALKSGLGISGVADTYEEGAARNGKRFMP
mmetsp:Transcript_1483/g.2132  ORF Transcript_1483/g.2132 Transcript_1483/m.2132 type:complete len:235 (+) Transcript_1483:95-799(+)|eukprot:CAMPEP_0196583524 /NCGR_PEP_ID=MMETSP1081-20130531/43886_1 /TAXON_ID=36882 /ORGANISM="Pyramimonas amylifera, Strain CCMP720" /LENGTH=234 /DNA_ID=CAMNT_0041904445 /DNA_START=90 /DNA_END=794 /DNA_ORIENTATION=-